MRKSKLFRGFVGILLFTILGLGLNMLLGDIGQSNPPASDPPYPPPVETQGFPAYPPPPDETDVAKHATAQALMEESYGGPIETMPPVPTPLPTPIVTSIPRSIFPITPLDTIDYPSQYSIVFPVENVLNRVDGEQLALSEFLDVFQKFSGYLVNRSFGLRSWGSPSPDGNRIAVVLSSSASPEQSPGDEPLSFSIQIIDATSGSAISTIEDGVNPSWSPDGTRIAYRSKETHGLWIFDLKTGQTEEVFPVDRTGGDYWVSYVSWSPDGGALAVVKTYGILEVGEVWVVDLEQTDQPTLLVPMDMYAGSINWSPKGDQILFLTSIGEEVTPELPTNLWTVDLASSELHQLTFNMTISGGTPQWSPDGAWIVFPGTNMLEGGKSQYDLWLVSPDGAVLQRLIDDAAFDLFPTWVDGARIVFLRVEAGIWEINLLDGELRIIYPEDVNFAIQQ